MTDIEAAKHNPAKIFKHPHDIIEDDSLPRKMKIEILKRWAYDEREIAVAEEENMQSEDIRHAIILDEVLAALRELGVNSDEDENPPTKQG